MKLGPAYETKLGHAHLKVRDLQRSIDFYTRYFSLMVNDRVGEQYAFLTRTDVHHELALQALGEGAAEAFPFSVGLYHIAFEVPDGKSLALAYQALKKDGVRVGPMNHHISCALYFSDPDGNGLEIYWDTRSLMKPGENWIPLSGPLDEEEILRFL